MVVSFRWYRWLLRHDRNLEGSRQSAQGDFEDGQAGSVVTTPARPVSNSVAATPLVSQVQMATSMGTTSGIENWAYDGAGDAISGQVPPPLPPVQQQQYQMVQASPAQQSHPLPQPSQFFGLHADSQYWLLRDCSRQSAEQHLANKADGTFLIRRSTTGSAPYARSIAYRGVSSGIGHIQILRSERGYGFTEPYLLFASLVDLVLHYTTHSLEEHNPSLTTTLAYPLFGPQPEINHYVLWLI